MLQEETENQADMFRSQQGEKKIPINSSIRQVKRSVYTECCPDLAWSIHSEMELIIRRYPSLWPCICSIKRGCHWVPVGILLFLGWRGFVSLKMEVVTHDPPRDLLLLVLRACSGIFSRFLRTLLRSAGVPELLGGSPLSSSSWGGPWPEAR